MRQGPDGFRGFTLMASQRELVLSALRVAGERGCCLEDFAKLDFGLPYRSRNVISELRRDHVPIEGSPCKVHAHRSSVFRYRLVQPGQQAMTL